MKYTIQVQSVPVQEPTPLKKVFAITEGKGVPVLKGEFEDPKDAMDVAEEHYKVGELYNGSEITKVTRFENERLEIEVK